MSPDTRVWVPTSEFIGRSTFRTSVDYWIWRRGRGLCVVYKDGLELRSDYGPLRNFLSAIATGREQARELLNGEKRPAPSYVYPAEK